MSTIGARGVLHAVAVRQRPSETNGHFEKVLHFAIGRSVATKVNGFVRSVNEHEITLGIIGQTVFVEGVRMRIVDVREGELVLQPTEEMWSHE